MKQRQKFLLRRFGLMLLSIFIIVTLLFVLFRIIPGDPTTQVADPSFTQEERNQVLATYGLDRPMHVQYVLYLKALMVGDLGLSFQHNQPVADLILNKALNTIVITVSAVIIAFTAGPVIGTYLASKRNTLVDTVGIGTVLVMYATPIFWTGMLALMIFSFRLGWFPTAGIRSPGHVPTSILDTYLSVDFLRHAFLPLVVFTSWRIAVPTLIMRNNTIDVLGAEFIELKRSEGINELKVIYGHAARNALLPVAHYGALALGFSFGGSVILETVFSWPGIGKLMWEAVRANDYPLAQGAFLFMAVSIIVLNFVIDVVSVYIDPRMASEEAEVAA